jgi:hypothetical protein
LDDDEIVAMIALLVFAGHARVICRCVQGSAASVDFLLSVRGSDREIAVDALGLTTAPSMHAMLV